MEVMLPLTTMESRPTGVPIEMIKQTLPSVVWGEPGIGIQEPLHVIQAAHCSVHEEEDEFNPFRFFN
jgi:hypothetical protein